jgi:putative acetyltransferase
MRSILPHMSPQVLALRSASRELVRELGSLEYDETKNGLPRSHRHALVEIEAHGEVAQSELSPLLAIDKSTASRLVADLVRRRCVRVRERDGDARARLLSLTKAGHARVQLVHREENARVEQALSSLGTEERAVVLHGIELYVRALERARRRAAYAIRPIRAGDRHAVARLIRTVMPEFGAKGPGFAINDPEVDDMFGAYQAKRSAYFVVTRRGGRRRDKIVVGGGGYAPLAGGDRTTCELRKMYFLPEVRGLGLGQALLDRCIADAGRARFGRMYLETLAAMGQARALYERSRFRQLQRPLGATGHFGCNSFYVRRLRQ